MDSLRGLALGDGFGERWFHRGNREAIEMIRARELPTEAPWHWTDDTAMALTIVRMLHLHGEIEPSGLAEMFAHHLDDLAGALWVTAEGLGDVDTTCAITGGVVAARTGLDGVPRQWLDLREPLPDWAETL